MSRKRTNDDIAVDESAAPLVVGFDNPKVLDAVLGSDFFEPLDILRGFMYLNKATRRVAAKKLNEYQYDAPMKFKQQQFAQWLRSPIIHAFDADMRLIPTTSLSKKSLQPHLHGKFVILKYENSYEEEKSQVAVFNSSGCLVAIYVLSSPKRFTGYHYEHMEFNIINFEDLDHNINITNSGQLKGVGMGQLKNAWNLVSSDILFEWNGIFDGDLCSANY